MSTTISLNPVTRISGFLQITVKLENSKVVDAESSGLLFRGFEKMLIGRSPLDTVYFTERICGICSAAHAVAASLTLEDALKITPDKPSRMLRDIIHGFEFLQNHLRQFYLYTLPDFVVTPDIQPVYSRENYDLRLPERLNNLISIHYVQAVEYSMLCHEALAVLGGKAPHNHGIFLGGVTESLNAYRYIQLKSILSKVEAFISDCMIEDVYTISEYYKEYFQMGKGQGNLMSYGLFNSYNEKNIYSIAPGTFIDGVIGEFNPKYISENIFNSWYKGDVLQSDLFKEDSEADMDKPNGYTFVKAPRYKGYSMEVGPLARMILSGNYKKQVSMMDRTIARVLEAKKIAETIKIFLDAVPYDTFLQKAYDIPNEAIGAGLTDTTRGALGHWLQIKDSKIASYNIITPSVWNCSPRDSNGMLGVIEQALVGTEIKNINHPVEIGRIVRSFDPCISCATHVISDKLNPLEILI
ncbi:nickel-dependent hydrogenase large subunit [Clostridium polynesiense]|uniref:nickel-dependent hydrogenase large subunit n=1 Tax=Clostridium polynesiense TaxID=1325933 RepID=UPI000590C141|nr:nickel-dependent hydrogenase large subunit [Clostridium polynesiense]